MVFSRAKKIAFQRKKLIFISTGNFCFPQFLFLYGQTFRKIISREFIFSHARFFQGQNFGFFREEKKTLNRFTPLKMKIINNSWATFNAVFQVGCAGSGAGPTPNRGRMRPPTREPAQPASQIAKFEIINLSSILTL